MEQIWQDREIRFDCSTNQINLRRGELLIDSLQNIEDTKGNPDEPGTMKITNLRIIWYCDTNPYINLSIGYGSIANHEVKVNYSGSSGNTQSLVLRCRFNNSKFEFIFSSSYKDSQRLNSTFQAVRRSYETTKMYRDLKMRGAIIQDRNLILLPQEKIVNKYSNIWNLSAEQGNVGTFITTNIRVVWFHNTSENFNASIPYIQIKSVKKKESKLGPALVIETFPQSGETSGYIMGFQSENLDMLVQEVMKLHKLHAANPIFGVETMLEDKSPKIEDVTIKRLEEDVEIVEPEYNEKNNSVMNYMTSYGAKEVNYS